MEKINLTFLGTGSAIPTAKRNHPAMLIQYKDENLLFDCGEGTQKQFRIAHLNPCKISRLLITHWHGDHVLGLPGLLQTLMLNGYNKTLEVYGPEGTERMMNIYLQMFVGKGDQLKINVNEIGSGKVFETDEFIVESEEMDHDTPSLAFSFTVKEKSRIDKKKLKQLKIPNGPLIGELKAGKTIEFKGKKVDGKKLIYKEDQRKVTIIMDTKINPGCQKIAKDSDILISESTYSKEETELAEEHFHLTNEQAATIAKKSNSKKLILTHLSQRYDQNTKIILDEAKKVFKNTQIAEDFMKVEI